MKFSQNQWQIDNYLIELGYHEEGYSILWLFSLNSSQISNQALWKVWRSQVTVYKYRLFISFSFFTIQSKNFKLTLGPSIAIWYIWLRFKHHWTAASNQNEYHVQENQNHKISLILYHHSQSSVKANLLLNFGLLYMNFHQRKQYSHLNFCLIQPVSIGFKPKLAKYLTLFGPSWNVLTIS